MLQSYRASNKSALKSDKSGERKNSSLPSNKNGRATSSPLNLTAIKPQGGRKKKKTIQKDTKINEVKDEDNKK